MTSELAYYKNKMFIKHSRMVRFKDVVVVDPSKKRKQVASILEVQRKKKCHLRNELDEDGGFDVNKKDNQYTSEKHENIILKLIEATMQIPTLKTFFINTNNEENFNNEIKDINIEIREKVEEVEEVEKEKMDKKKDVLEIVTRNLQKDIKQQDSSILKLRLQSIYHYFSFLNKK
ncbi:hypothetical protein Glove_26g191 [Diversispora epigaea]|uniref:Uncharacterized protein n=1 Tax=Diversispora epigaea TaxID=1348612 RepID=A0A397JMV3_9GLOM|nr:hypothetical protein Glove_26g191 [Diversispora epigaea]